MNHPENKITIEAIVDSFSARLEKGDRPSIAEYKQKYPHLAERIDAILPALVVLENVDSDHEDRKLAVDDSIPEVLGDYRIIQEIGRGGMGIVFEAQHATMRRRVALKVLPKSSAEKPNYLSRFLTEARSAGQLHHTNIVPVFEVGESEGIHYYSMQFIHGDNLDHVIDDIRKLRQESHNSGNELRTTGQKRHFEPKHHSARSRSISMAMLGHEVTENAVGDQVNGSVTKARRLHEDYSQEMENGSNHASVFRNDGMSQGPGSRSEYHRRAAAIGKQVAKALAHAHEHGVLHRDVKPANLILDTEGTVWITDFGLAKLDSNDLTQTGDIIGTLRYMAPERFNGVADSRSDIYSLGLTLYELCTLRCAFENDRGTLVQDVANSSSVVQPRIIDESIPADLETIILKAIDPQPDRRYATAEGMARDLDLFLADRPICARRATWAERSYRICRRNPIASSLAACLVVLLVVITAGSIQFARSESRNRKDSQKSLFYSKLDQAKMRRYSGRPGQRFEAMQAIRDAVELLPEMEFQDAEIRETEYLLRSEIVAATKLTDIDRKWTHQFEEGWGESTRCAIDATGNLYAEGHQEGTIRVRRISDNKILHELPGAKGNDPAWGIYFSPDGRYLVAKYHQPNVHNELLTVVWDVRDRQQAYVTRRTRDMCFSHDSQLLAIGYSDRVELVRLDDGKVIRTVFPEFTVAGNVSQVELNHDATEVAISRASTGIIEFWDIGRTPYLEASVDCGNPVLCMTWDSNREIFAAGAHQGTLHYWLGDLSKNPEVIRLHQNSIYEMHLHPQRELIATSAWDATTRFTDLVAGKEVLSVENHKLGYSGFCANGRLGLQDENGDLGVWHVALPMIQVFSAPENEPGFACCIHPDYKNIVGRTIGQSFEFLDVQSRRRLLVKPAINVRAMVFSRSGEYFFASGKNGLWRWKVNCDGSQLKLLDETLLVDQSTGSIDLAHNNNWLLVAVGSQLRLLEFETGDVVREFGTHGNLNRLRLTADDRFALSGTWHGYGIKIWDVETGQCLQTVNEKIGSASPVPHPTDPTRFFVGRNQTSEFSLSRARIESTDTPAVWNRKLKHEGIIHLTDLGENMLVQTNSFNLILMDTETQREWVKIVSARQSRIIGKCLSSDRSTLVLACFDNLQIINLNRLQDQLRELGLNWD